MSTPWMGWRRLSGTGAPRVAFGIDQSNTVTLYERVRPLVSLDVLLAQHLERLRVELVLDLVSQPIVSLTTNEGEYGAIVTITGVQSGLSIEHTLGVIYGDDFHTLIDARSHDALHHAVVRTLAHTLVVELPLGLGAVRYRRFAYRSPADWTRSQHHLTDTWSSSDGDGTILVLPARPLHQSEHIAQLDNLLRDDSFGDLVVERSLPGCGIETDNLTGIVGGVVATLDDGPRRVILTAALRDSRFLYVMRLQTSIAQARPHEAAFLSLVRSCKQIPSRIGSSSPALAHWAM